MKKHISIVKTKYIAICRLIFISLVVFQIRVYAQENLYFVTEPATLSQIYSKLQRLNHLGRVMYIAAHPDDENQKIISYFNYSRHFDVAYLSLTRGDGGQNLIGNEIKSELGLIRTFELLKARHIDGGKQLFTKAIDFGYSKTAEETLKLWNKKAILGDVVKLIRQYQPDIIILRFPPDKRAGHGHHTASAILALEAFDIANNKDMYPEHFRIKGIKLWQPKRIFINTGRWWNKNINDDSQDIIKVNIGQYDNFIGKSYHQIAIKSRTSHKSQGFGSSIFPQQEYEYLELIKGEKVKTDAFEGIDTSWSRIKNGKNIGKHIKQILDNFDFKNPCQSINPLLDIKNKIKKIDDNGPLVKNKLKTIDEIIIDILGLYTAAYTNTQMYNINDQLKVKFFVNNRSPIDVKLEKIENKNGTIFYNETKSLDENIALQKEFTIPVKAFVFEQDNQYTQPFWLKNPFDNYNYDIEEKDVGLAMQEYPFMLYATLDINENQLIIPIPIKHFRNDPVDGKILNPIAVVPAVSIKPSQNLLIISDEKPKTIDINIRSSTKIENLTLDLIFKDNKVWKWTLENSEEKFSLEKNEEKQIKIKVFPPKNETLTNFDIVLKNKENNFNKTVKRLKYNHIPKVVYTLSTKIKAIKINLKKSQKKIAYIMGTGDKIPTALEELGFNIDIINHNISLQDLNKYDVLILGIRALNTIDDINYYMDTYFKFVAQGGNMIVQYNTSRRLKTQKLAPYDLTLGRGRVTDEYSELKLLYKKHSALNVPNKITKSDFNGWVQERGLYFPQQWDEDAFTPLISWHDKNEKPLKGALLVAKHQQGTFTYTGISFFRQVPAGVPGAIRLFTNLIEQ